MNEKLLTQIAQQQMRALTLLEQTPLTPTRRKLIERHLAINERLTEIACRPPMRPEPQFNPNPASAVPGNPPQG